MTFDLSDQFARFAGRVVAVSVKEETITIGGKTYSMVPAITIAANDPAVVELAAEARKAGLYLQLHAIGYQYEKHLRRDLLNAYLEKGSDNQWRIGAKFTFG